MLAKSIIGVGILLLLAVIFGAATSFHFLLLWSLSKVEFLGITVSSNNAYWLFSIGMMLIFIPAFIIELASKFLMAIVGSEVYEKIKASSEAILSFIFGFLYIHFLEKFINNLSMSLVGQLTLTLIYCLMFDFVDSGKIEQKYTDWRKKRRIRRRKVKERRTMEN